MSEYSLEEEKNKINYLFDEILNLSNKIRIEYIIDYDKNISKNVNNVFKELSKNYTMLNKKYIDNKLKIFFLQMVILDGTQFNKLTDLKISNDFLEFDISQFMNFFSSYSEYLQNKIIMDFDKAFAIAKQNNDREVLKKIYSCYQTMIVGIIAMLPNIFKEKIINVEGFQDALETIKILNLNLNLNLKISDINKLYVEIIEKKINEILLDNYNTSLYDNYKNILKRV